MLNQDFARRIADDELIILIKRDNGWDEVGTIFARDDDGRAALHVGDEGVGGAEINSDDAVVVIHVFTLVSPFGCNRG